MNNITRVTKVIEVFLICILFSGIGYADTAKDVWTNLIGKKSNNYSAFAFIENNPVLPNVLIYGDSISIGYTPQVQKRLKDKANVYRVYRNGRDSGMVIRVMEYMHKKMLPFWPFKWDVIHFNAGLHDLIYLDKNKRYDTKNGKQVSTEDYKKNLKKVIEYFKAIAPDAKIIFATTTPVPENSRGRIAGDAVKYNKAARSLLKNYPEIIINDLYGFTKPNQSKWWKKPGDIHYNKSGEIAQGDKVASLILNALEQKQKMEPIELHSYSISEVYDKKKTPQEGLERVYSFLDEGSVKTADQILKNIWKLPRYDAITLPWPLTWKETYHDSEPKYWHFIFYSHRHMKHLLYAYLKTGEIKYRDRLIAIVTSFSEDGITAAEEYINDKHTAAYLALSLVNFYSKLQHKGDLDIQTTKKWESAIFNRGLFLADPKNFEGHFNHGVTEGIALLLIAETFPDWQISQEWKKIAIERLEKISIAIIDEDGVLVEQSPFYHAYTLNLFWQIVQWDIRNNLGLLPVLKSQVNKMIDHLIYITQPDGQIPLLGSSALLVIDKTSSKVINFLKEKDPFFSYICSKGEKGTPPRYRNRLYPTAGFSILRSDFGKDNGFINQTHITFDVGPYRTNHSHFDGLSINLYGAGGALIPDSGLYSYRKSEDKAYFWSTRAHNTVVVDDADQKKGAAYPLNQLSDRNWSYQSGYHQLYDGVRHTRGLLLIDREWVLVVDQMKSNFLHQYSQTWHLFPNAKLDEKTTDYLLVTEQTDISKVSIYQLNDTGMTSEQVKGQEAPIMDGWFSELYNRKKPNWSIKYHKNSANAQFVTLFRIGDRAGEELKVASSSRDGTISLKINDSVKLRSIDITQFGKLNLETVTVNADSHVD